MAKSKKTVPQTQKVWTAQDFRERNERVDLQNMAKAESVMQNTLIPYFTGVLNDRYKSDSPEIERIQLIDREIKDLDINDYVIRAIIKWAKPLGYKVDWNDLAVYLIIPAEPEAEKNEDS